MASASVISMTDNQTILNKFLCPKSIVVVGASNNKSKPGGSITKNIMGSYTSGELYLVNQNSETIDGKQSYARVEDLPEGIDLAFIAIPAKGVYREIEKLSAKNCKVVVVLTAGFGETDENGKAEEKRLVELADKEGIALVGPNVVGIVSPNYYGKFAGMSAPDEKELDRCGQRVGRHHRIPHGAGGSKRAEAGECLQHGQFGADVH